MNARKQIWVMRVVRAGFFSPMWFVGRALLITIFYFACHAAGLREQTTFLSGTAAGVGTSLNSSAVMGMTYLVAYFGFVLVAPIFLVAALLMAGFQNLVNPKSGLRRLWRTTHIRIYCSRMSYKKW